MFQCYNEVKCESNRGITYRIMILECFFMHLSLYFSKYINQGSLGGMDIYLISHYSILFLMQNIAA